MTERLIGPALEGVTEVEVDDQVCLYSPATNEVLMLNQTASDVWLLCDGQRTLEQITALLASSYQVSPDSISPEVDAAIRSFTEAGLLARS